MSLDFNHWVCSFVPKHHCFQMPRCWVGWRFRISVWINLITCNISWVTKVLEDNSYIQYKLSSKMVQGFVNQWVRVLLRIFFKSVHNWEPSVVSGNQANIWKLRAVIWSQTTNITYQLQFSGEKLIVTICEMIILTHKNPDQNLKYL